MGVSAVDGGGVIVRYQVRRIFSFLEGVVDGRVDVFHLVVREEREYSVV